jgi:hypothetical protein
MPQVRLPSALCAAALLAAPAAHADAAAVTRVIEHAVDICGTAILRPEDAREAALLRGYSGVFGGRVNTVMQSSGGGGSDGSFVITETQFSDAVSIQCTFTAMTPLAADEVRILKTIVERMDGIGPMEGDVGQPKEAAGTATLFGTYKRPGNDPAIHLHVFSTERFATIVFTLTKTGTPR